jgi:F-type H+-transporting ATPase subunit b
MEFNATFIVSAISFIVFTIIMNAIFYKPLQRIVSERQKFLDETYEEAKKNQEKSKAILKDKEKKIESTKLNAKKIILDKSEEAKNKKVALTSEVQQKANQEVETAKSELQKSTQEAEKVLSNEAKKLAENISAKILGT